MKKKLLELICAYAHILVCSKLICGKTKTSLNIAEKVYDCIMVLNSS